MPGNLISHAAPIAAVALYCSCIALWVWSPSASKILLLVINLVTAVAIIAFDVIPLRYVLNDERLMAIVAFEAAVLITWVASVFGNRPALIFSYVFFAIHFCAAVVWVWFVYYLHIDRLF